MRHLHPIPRSLCLLSLSIVELVNWIAHLVTRGSLLFEFNDLFTGNYANSVRPYWLITNIIGVAIMALFAPLYVLWLKGAYRSRGKEDVDTKFMREGVDEIPANRHVSKRAVRVFLVYLVFVFVLAIQVCVEGRGFIAVSVESDDCVYL